MHFCIGLGSERSVAAAAETLAPLHITLYITFCADACLVTVFKKYSGVFIMGDSSVISPEEPDEPPKRFQVQLYS